MKKGIIYTLLRWIEEFTEDWKWLCRFRGHRHSYRTKGSSDGGHSACCVRCHYIEDDPWT